MAALSWRNLCDFCHASKFFPKGLREGLISVVCGNWNTMGAFMLKSPIVKRSILVNGHKTSVSLEDEFWSALKVIAGKRIMKLQDLVTAIDMQRQHSNLSSAIRLFVLDFYRRQASDIEAEVNLHEMMLATRPWSAQ
jgi:predicted DNA-binding ribbon-helix-helix protein